MTDMPEDLNPILTDFEVTAAELDETENTAPMVFVMGLQTAACRATFDADDQRLFAVQLGVLMMTTLSEDAFVKAFLLEGGSQADVVHTPVKLALSGAMLRALHSELERLMPDVPDDDSAWAGPPR